MCQPLNGNRHGTAHRYLGTEDTMPEVSRDAAGGS